MQTLESLEDVQRLVGELGQTIPRLSLAERRHVRAVLKASDLERLDAGWIIRLSLAAGLPLSHRRLDPVQICQALPARDIGRFLDRLSSQELAIDAEVPLEAITRTLNRADAPQTFHSLLRLAHSGVHPGFKGSLTTRTRFRPQTALALLKTATRIAAFVVPDTTALSKQQFLRRRTTIKLFVDLAYLTAQKCETPDVSAAILELMIGLSRRVGWIEFERAIETNAERWSYLYLLPAELVPALLSRKRIAEIETLASRAALFEGSREAFEKALWNALTQKPPTIPMASREWVEGFLGLRKPPKLPDLHSKSIDTASDVNLERMATLLLAAWEARDEGAGARHLFQLFSGICKTAFRLSLAGDPGDTAEFDPAVHEASGGNVMTGGRVRLLRPWVQWGEPPVTRVIVRALVSPVEQVGR
ncbi:MAG: hypothetical protein WCC04_21680 [Terriglobales bacterium]